MSVNPAATPTPGDSATSVTQARSPSSPTAWGPACCVAPAPRGSPSAETGTWTVSPSAAPANRLLHTAHRNPEIACLPCAECQEGFLVVRLRRRPSAFQQGQPESALHFGQRGRCDSVAPANPELSVVPAAQPLLASLCAQQVRMGRCLVPRLPALPVCLAVVQLLSPCSAEFAVVGPPEPILVMVGEDADLPCHLSPKMNAEALQLMWERPGRRQVVHVYAHGQEDTPAEEFRGRTSIIREDVTAGKAALRIHNVSVSDNGTYLCYFQDGDFFENAQVELQVAVLGSDPHIDMKGYEAGGIRVNCTSAGWYPQPQIQWRDAKGQSLSSEAVCEAADPQGLYAASASVILEEGSGEGVSCVIRNPPLGQERSARLSIPGSFFRNTKFWVVVLSLASLSLVVLLLHVGYLLWRRWRSIQALFQEEGRAGAEREAAQAELQQEGSAQGRSRTW
ncbi:butyrophilin subfamily 3 member A2-like isoform X2 [Phyllostomus hastatus]|uniref:butyrophilin subfamily 3 member A2-like isoform X2 n=1 Tax=Phyllostomus hastatus TaxID=9423 RepID=UPI001E681DD2|nr:butyrophilin subfamily 3 member A2-like isoform X2 [Phyllostomus hastatus]